jgi:glycosyltransferase involved in cell wall biosynthesis
LLLLDVSRLIWRRWVGCTPTGIDRVCLAYLERFGAGALAMVQRRRWRGVLDDKASKDLFALLREPGPDFRARLVRQAAGWPLRRVAEAKLEGALYLNIGHTGLDEPSLADWIRRHRLKAVYFVHDLIPLTHPEYCREGESERHQRRMATVLASAAGVIGNSRHTLGELSAFARRTGRAMPPAVAALLGSEQLAAEPEREAQEPSGRSHFVALGTIEGRKNHLLLLQLWLRLGEELGERVPRLLIVGRRGWEAEQVLDLLDRSAQLRRNVVELSDCSDGEVAGLLRSARALLFPSFAEGYGLPVAEALRNGTPVIASDLDVFREIAGNVPDYLDPLDGPAWRQAILDYSADPSPRREAQLERLKELELPSWRAHFEAVEPWLARL